MGGFALGRRVRAGITAGACVLSASAHLAHAWIGDDGANSLGDGWEAEHCARREGTSLTLQMYFTSNWVFYNLSEVGPVLLM